MYILHKWLPSLMKSVKSQALSFSLIAFFIAYQLVGFVNHKI